jgi:pimeloyl-ACP methyl ester carboxylesterase
MGLDSFSHRKRFVTVGDARIAYYEEGEGTPLDIPGAVRLELLPETGHLLMEERPERFAELVDQFLAEAVVAKGGTR